MTKKLDLETQSWAHLVSANFTFELHQIVVWWMPLPLPAVPATVLQCSLPRSTLHQIAHLYTVNHCILAKVLPCVHLTRCIPIGIVLTNSCEQFPNHLRYLRMPWGDGGAAGNRFGESEAEDRMFTWHGSFVLLSLRWLQLSTGSWWGSSLKAW